MAITRAQQVKQMLREGGRIGFRIGSGEGKDFSGRDYGSGSRAAEKVANRAGSTRGRDLDFQQRGESKEDYAKTSEELRKKGITQVYGGGEDKPPQITDRESFVPTPVKFKGPVQSFRDKQMQKFLTRSKVNALRYLGLLDKPALLPTGALLQSFENLPEAYENITEDQINSLALEVAKLKAGGQNVLTNQMITGKDKLSNIFEAEDLLRKGELSQSKFDEMFPGPDIPDDRGQQETDPCKGPNPPAYCFVNQPGDDPDDGDDDTNTGGLALRFRKDGGRIGADKGGIMKASYGYDDAMGEAFEEFLRLKKIKEIPEDMEFDEYLDQLDIDVPYSKKDKGEQRVMAQEGGMMDSPVGGIMDLETGRQMYFLGKLVKKASRALKKITKSPIGKAAILGGALYFGGGGGLPKLLSGKGLGGFSAKTFFSKANPLLFSKGELSLGKLAALSAASPFLFQEDEEEDQTLDRGPSLDIARIRNNPYDFLGRAFVADGGIMRLGYQEGSKEPVAKKTMPLLDMGGKEMDLRDNGGFVPIGRMEKADDVPARLSKNEFVFTAEAVRNAGEGDVDKGAEVMYNMMKNLEAGGEVSEESQGLEGARKMFQTSKRLEEVL